MNARVAIVCLLGCALLCEAAVQVSTVSVFVTEQLISTYRDLRSRQCLPANFNTSRTVPHAKACAPKVKGGGLPSECAGAPLLAMFYACYSRSYGTLNADATSFDVATVKNDLATNTDDQVWTNAAQNMVDECQQASVAGLTARREAVHTYSCLKWSLFADCDQQQEDTATLDAAGALRRARFLSGDCPLSPSTLNATLEQVTNRTWESCSQGPNIVDNATQLYDTEVSRVVCLLQDFSDASGNVDLPELEQAIAQVQGGASSQVAQLLEVVTDCGEETTTEGFVKCWAGMGVFDCIYEEANQMASQFPDTCDIFVDVN